MHTLYRVLLWIYIFDNWLKSTGSIKFFILRHMFFFFWYTHLSRCLCCWIKYSLSKSIETLFEASFIFKLSTFNLAASSMLVGIQTCISANSHSAHVVKLLLPPIFKLCVIWPHIQDNLNAMDFLKGLDISNHFGLCYSRWRRS